jgi:hypothetical protein
VLTIESERAALAALRRVRRRRRLRETDWIEVLYKAYTAALISLGALVALALVVGDGKLSHTGVHDLESRAPALIGLFVAVGVGLGLRSGARGGPLALEAAEVHHVLLAPIERGVVFRQHAYRQLRGLLLFAVVGGGLTGLLVSQRIPNVTGASAAGWIAADAATAVLMVLAIWGATLVASGHRLAPLVALVIGVVLALWSLADVLAGRITSPASMLGALAVWPQEVRLVALVGVVLALAVPVLGVLGVGGTSIEECRRRSGLVGAMRFAATVQDMRTVIVLHRLLSQENTRSRPWFVLPPRPGAGGAFWRRDWFGVLRWPVVRAGRVVGLVVLAALATYGAWRGTTPLVVLAGLALFIAALDCVEPLAQELDHPDIGRGVPAERGALYIGHLMVPTIVMVCVSVLALAVVAAIDPAPGVAAVGAITIVPVAIAAVAGAAASVVLGTPNLAAAAALGSAEFATMYVVARQAFPPILVILSLAPVVAARAAVNAHVDPFGVAVWAALPAILISDIVITVVRNLRWKT